ncbi:MAG TPA: glycosyltransferase family 2 protein [Verrucomicrobiae bacterium]|nr:glycosyltransferase family 2 protein [Verrucomicrobiae bacterium]
MAEVGKISFIIPVYNEEENLRELHGQILQVARQLGGDYEVLFVDDCSTDGSLGVIRDLAAEHPEVRWVSFSRNTGQSAALAAGFAHSTGEVVVTMDADLQNDPADIPAMLSLYGEYDMVNGWRFNRRDTISKKIASRIGNFVRNRLTAETIHDTGCSLKVMRGEMVRRISMFRGLHRFLPTLMRMEGARVVEVKVNHRPRLHGVSKYTNLRRGIEGFYDLIAVRWMMKRRLHIQVREKHPAL